jgi:hypothetical protein
MAIKYNNQNVDEAYSNKLEANLYYGGVLVPGVTCSDDFVEGPAGGIYVHKLSTSSAEPGKPGRDFTDEETNDSLIQIVLNNNFQKSKKIYNVQAAAVSADLKDAQLAAAQAEVREGWCLSGLGCLVNEGKASTDTAAATADNCVDMVIDARTEIVKDKGAANVVMCAPSFYAMVLKAAGKDFTPNTNDRIKTSGQVGRYLGMTWVEANGLGGTVKYYDYSGTLKTVDTSKVDFVIYNHETLSVVSNIDMARLVDSEMFNGCKAQVEQNTGYRVRNNVLARVHKHTA